MLKRLRFVAAVLVCAVVPLAAAAQQPPTESTLPPATVCGQQVRPAAQPPAGSGPVVLYIAPCFEAQGGTSLIEGLVFAMGELLQTKIVVPPYSQYIGAVGSALLASGFIKDD